MPPRKHFGCQVPACKGKHHAKGLCASHHARMRRYGDPLAGGPPVRKKQAPVCVVGGCEIVPIARDLCWNHYMKQRRKTEKGRAYKREYGARSYVREKENARLRERYRTDAEYRKRIAERDRRRRQLRPRGHRGEWTPVLERDWRRLLNRYDGMCAYCKVAPAESIDHVVPVSRGGSDMIGNYLPACKSCNSSKCDKLLVEWRGTEKRIAERHIARAFKEGVEAERAYRQSLEAS